MTHTGHFGQDRIVYPQCTQMLHFKFAFYSVPYLLINELHAFILSLFSFLWNELHPLFLYMLKVSWTLFKLHYFINRTNSVCMCGVVYGYVTPTVPTPPNTTIIYMTPLPSRLWLLMSLGKTRENTVSIFSVSERANCTKLMTVLCICDGVHI
jgi:hypothetical protein